MNTLRSPNSLHPVWRAAFGGIAAFATLAACSSDGPVRTTPITNPSWLSGNNHESGFDFTTSDSSTYPEAGPAVLLPGSEHEEIQQFGADTFTDYRRAAGKGPHLPKGVHVIVDCLAIGPIEAAESANRKWYHMTKPEQFAGRFAAANTFENGDTSGPLSDQPMVDPAVPLCP